MACRIRKNDEGREYQYFFWSAQDVRDDVRRYRTTPAKARKRIEEIQNLIAELLVPGTTDARRATIVNMLKRRLCEGYSRVEDLAALAKIATGEVDPRTRQYIERPRPSS